MSVWSRAIILMDMDAFFASIEQHDDESLQNKPVAITNGEQGTCIITCSYEARAFGVKTGMRTPEAKHCCPNLIKIPGRPERYTELSKRIMIALHRITPDIEIFSVDEAFLDVTHCQKLHGSPDYIGKLVREIVYEVSGLTCSVGVSGDKTTAKFAAKLNKPNGLTIIPPWEAKERLKNVPVTDLCGIAKGISQFLLRYGVITCGDMEKIPISILAKRFGNLGRRIWYMCQGGDPEPMHLDEAAPKSMGHGKVMPPKTTDPQIVLTYLLHMCEKVAARLRRHALEAQHFFIGLRHRELGWIGDKLVLPGASNDARLLFQSSKVLLKKTWHGEPVCQIQVTALDPRPEQMQGDLFSSARTEANDISKVLDSVNNRYGELMLAPARLLLRSKMKNVIAPAWRPDGHRQSI